MPEQILYQYHFSFYPMRSGPAAPSIAVAAHEMKQKPGGKYELIRNGEVVGEVWNVMAWHRVKMPEIPSLP